MTTLLLKVLMAKYNNAMHLSTHKGLILKRLRAMLMKMSTLILCGKSICRGR